MHSVKIQRELDIKPLESYYREFLIYLQKERGFSRWTIASYKAELSIFFSWSEQIGYFRPAEFNKGKLEDYRLYLVKYKKVTEEKLCASTINARISRVKGFFRYLYQKNYIIYNPATGLEFVKDGRRLPRNILTEDEAERVLREPNINKPLGIRDRAILETFYSTGIRKSELMNLKTYNVDFNDRVVIIKKGKWSNDRIVPVGKRALYWINKYLRYVRVELLQDKDEEYLFLDRYGRQINGNLLGTLVIYYIKKAGLHKRGACHIFRHSMATHMLENGASIRYIQQMLGHKNIETTQIYTHVSIKKLKEIHRKTHPSEITSKTKSENKTKQKSNKKTKPLLTLPDNKTGIYVRPKQDKVYSLADELLKKPAKDTMEYYLKNHLEYMKGRGYSALTIRKRKYTVLSFFSWCNKREPNAKKTIKDITEKTITKYQHYIYDCKNKKTGKTLSIRTKIEKLSSVYLFFKYLAEKDFILYNPAEKMELPRVHKHLPGNILTDEEAKSILSQPNINEPLGFRDRAILEILYSTGIRRSEICNIKLENLDLKEKTLFILDGKGQKDRLIPVGESAVYWCDRYQKELRNLLLQNNRLLKNSSNKAFFLNGQGRKLSSVYLGNLISGYVKKAEIGKAGGCLLFRHSMATRMLENGADIRFIQQMLGHADLKTTELYTHVSIKKLKEVHEKTHPARLSKILE
jgi:integrase/recombinase XerD